MNRFFATQIVVLVPVGATPEVDPQGTLQARGRRHPFAEPASIGTASPDLEHQFVVHPSRAGVPAGEPAMHLDHGPLR